MPTSSTGDETRFTDLSVLTADQLDRRRRIVDAAFELGADGGYDAVQIRDVAAIANVALATIYRYFSSKDHLLAAAMTEWTGRLQSRVAQSPPRGDTAADQLIDVLRRACGAMERQPKLAMALVRALSSSDRGVSEAGGEVQRQIAAMGSSILAHLDDDTRAAVLEVLGHVWYSTLVSWANGRTDIKAVTSTMERAARVLVEPYEPARIAALRSAG